MLRAAGRLTPERATLAVAIFAGALTLWNTAAYPWGAGYDAASHKEYADFLIQHLRLPVRNETPEYYSPPLYYGVAGGVTWIGRQIGLGEPHKLGQLLNVPLVIGSVLLLAALARLLWPERRWLAPGAAAFLALSPVLVRTAAMFHPEPADLFASVLCTYLAARMIVRREYTVRAALGLGGALGAAQMIRQFELYTLAVVAIAWVVTTWRRWSSDRRAIVRSGLVALAACIVVAGPWYGYRAANYSNALFDRPHPHSGFFSRRAAGFYVNLAPTTVFSTPYRPHLQNLAWPETYSDIWGDWYGVFNWSLEQRGTPSPAHVDWLVAQNAIGIIPTAVAIIGWLALLAAAVRRRGRSVELLVAAMPLAALAGYFYFAIGYPTPDGDVLKPTFMLAALWAWALCFAWGAAHLPRRALLVLGALAVLEMPFLVYTGAGGFF